MLILASRSPRRQELLQKITADFTVQSADVDETLPAGMPPHEAVAYLSRIKAMPFQSPSDTVIGADTVVALDGTILGKPGDEADAVRMLTMLSGREHRVHTGVTVLHGLEQPITFSCCTKVTFYPLEAEEIRQYIATGEAMDKAGAYGIQGRGALFVKEIAGDYYNVVGLPVSALYRALKL